MNTILAIALFSVLLPLLVVSAWRWDSHSLLILVGVVIGGAASIVLALLFKSHDDEPPMSE